MPYLLNVIYLLILIIFSPWLLYKALTTGKYRRGLWTKFTGRVPTPVARPQTITVWFHGVSVGEIHLLRQVVAGYRRRHPDHACVVSTSTDTGFDEAGKAFPDLPVIFWPFDFTWAVHRALARVRPDLVVLAEGEIWPNFIRAARRLDIRMAVINGRMSPRSARRHGKLSWLLRGTFGRIDACAVQTEEYAAGFRNAGAPRIVVTGNVKYDGACADRDNPRTRGLRDLLGVRPGELVWVAGSTQDPEEEIVLGIYRRALEKHANLRLVLVPRHKERFDPVADLLERSGLPYLRRSRLTSPTRHPATPSLPVLLLDTFGELSAAWGLADVAFVGGSLDGKRGGQNMIEPAAYGAAVTFGPSTWNFKDTVARLLQKQAAIQVPDAAGLEWETLRLLADAAARGALGQAARKFVTDQQGATERTLEMLDALCWVQKLSSRDKKARATAG
ncbi:MAG TPA: 3-deoxy-D-manno-octulosonic acid transferase [Gemmataceae bacterium]|jgi:3-deoxy-D-manno-octulosonic-acid transferase|nr:3-deoxy-D-manno-octulosonic acid transferase [Gemmataceae bacterium]